MPTNEIQLVVSAQDNASANLKKVSSEVTNLSGKTNQAAKSNASLLTGMFSLTASYFALKAAVYDTIKAYDESAAVQAQTNAVLQSTRGAAGMTAEAIGNLSSQLQLLTTYSDEAIQGAENLLLTFTAIGKDIFPQATQTVLDMSSALGQDLKGSAIQLGKALQDPILGVTALKRVGVNFSDAQKEVIKTLVDSGKKLEAQKMILKELNLEFGGSAAAALTTFGGKLKWANNQVGELKEGIGAGLVNGLLIASGESTKFIDNITKLSDELIKAKQRLSDVEKTGDKFQLNKAIAEVQKLQVEIDNTTSEFNGRMQDRKIALADTVSRFIIGFKMIGQQLYNVGKLIVVVFAAVYKQIEAFVKDGVAAFKNFGQNVSDIFAGIKTAMSGGGTGELAAALGKTFENTTKTLVEGGKEIDDAWGAFSKTQEQAVNDTAQAYQDNERAIRGTSKEMGEMTNQTDELAGASAEMAKKIEEAAKKVRNLKEEMAKAIKEAKQDIKDLKASYQAQEKEAQNTLGQNIAQEIFNAQKEQKEAKDELGKAQTEEEKKQAQEKLDTATAFLAKHEGEQKTYAAQIANLQYESTLDSIQLLQKQFEEEEKVRAAAYKVEMKELKNKLNEVKKEYKKKLKELKDEIHKDGLDRINIEISTSSKGSGSNKRALGGEVTAGTAYVVGENRPEVFVPSQSGNIKQIEQVGGRGITVNFNNPVVRNDADLSAITAIVERTLNRRQELTSMGAI